MRPSDRLIAAILASLSCLVLLLAFMNVPAPTQPRLILWAWEKSGDLSWIDSRRVGVAFLAETLTLYDGSLWCKPRTQSLNSPPQTHLIAVVRVESSRKQPPTLSPDQLDMLVERIKIHARTPGVRGVQIDFDAPLSQRSFYRELLSRLHSELPRHVELSMTALASWCIGDRWLDKTAADEVVPMFFYMGSDKPNVLRHIRDGRSFACSRKRMAIGLAVDDKEALMTFAHGRAKRILNGRKVYLFSGRGWSKAALEQVEKELAIYDSDELG